MHDAACDAFALAAASIGDHVRAGARFPWALALRLSTFLIAMAEIVAMAEEQLHAAQETSFVVNVEARQKSRSFVACF